MEDTQVFPVDVSMDVLDQPPESYGPRSGLGVYGSVVGNM